MLYFLLTLVLLVTLGLLARTVLRRRTQARRAQQPRLKAAITSLSPRRIAEVRKGSEKIVLVILIAEGLSESEDGIPIRMANLAIQKWMANGRPRNWLFFGTGAKSEKDGRLINLLGNDGQPIALPARQECTIPLFVLREKGVPIDQLAHEAWSDTTYQQVEAVQHFLVASGLTPDDVEIVLVTHDLHANRVRRSFEMAGMTISDVLTVEYRPDSGQPWSLFHMHLPRKAYEGLEAVAVRQYVKLGLM